MTESAQLFKCPACGASLEPQPGQSVVKCQYCNSSVVVPGATGISTGTAGMTIDLRKIVGLIRAGNKIEAIKEFREKTGSGLAEAKNVVDAIELGQAVDITRFLDIERAGSLSLGSPDADGQTPLSTSGLETTIQQTRKAASRRTFCLLVAVLSFILLTAGLTLVLVLRSGGNSSLTISNPIPTVFPTFSRPVLSFGEEGTGAGMLNDPRYVGVDRNGDIYAGDYGDGRINIFDATGKFMSLINLGGKTYIQGMAVAPDDTLYVGYNGVIHRLDSSGQDQGVLDYQDADGNSAYFESFAVGADGSLVAADESENLVRFKPDGTVDLVIPQSFSAVTGDPELDIQLAVDGLGNIYALGTFNTLVLKYSPDGKYLDQFGGDTRHPAEGVDPGYFEAPNTIAVDGYGRVYVSDIWGVQVFDSNGQYQKFFEVDGVAFGMAFDLNNDLYVASNTPRIIKLQIQKP